MQLCIILESHIIYISDMKKFLMSLMLLSVALGAMAQLLWKIQAPGARPSYLLGTCHFVEVEYADSIPGFDDAFAACDTLYTEIGMPDAAAVQSSMMELAQRLMAEPPLGDKLTAATADALCDYILQRNGGDSATIAADIRQLNLIGLFLKYPSANVMADLQTGFQVEMPMDLGLVNYARYLDMEELALEGLDYQLSLLGEFVSNNDEEAFKGMMEGNQQDDARRLIADYKSAELNRLYSQFEQYRGLKNIEELIEGRNRAWVDRLVPSLRSGALFIAVGAGHLPGDQGLISRLRLAGFAVEPV